MSKRMTSTKRKVTKRGRERENVIQLLSHGLERETKR